MGGTRVLILPGIGNSGPEHWQSLWESANPSFQRVYQRDWDNPVCKEWVSALEESVTRSGRQSVLVAHSLACLLVAYWALSTRHAVKGALLVAAPDPEGPNFPKEPVGFTPVPRSKLPFPSIVVASLDDPYSSIEYAQGVASSWDSRFVNIGAAGHINAASGLGEWPEGAALLTTLLV